MTTQNLPSGSLIVREHKGKPFYEAKWQYGGVQVKRRVGPAWLDRDSEGHWMKRRGRTGEGFWDQRTATVRMSELVREHSEDQGIASDRRDATFSEAAQHWLEYMSNGNRSKPSTINDYRRLLSPPGDRSRGQGKLKARIMLAFGDKRIRLITTADIDRFLAKLERDDVSSRTVNKNRQLLHAIFEYCRKPGTFGLKSNPVSATEKRRESAPTPIEYFSPEELSAIARAASEGLHRSKPDEMYGEEVHAEWRRFNEQDAALFIVAAQTGLRQGEIRALLWKDVDFNAQSVTVSRAISGGEVESTKSRKMRTVGLTLDAAKCLESLSRRERYAGPDDLVFCGSMGGALDGNAITRRFKNAQGKAGVSYRRFHALRHTFCSQLVAKGFDVVEVKTLAGHASIQTTERYLHSRPRSDQAKRMTEAFRAEAIAEVEEVPQPT